TIRSRPPRRAHSRDGRHCRFGPKSSRSDRRRRSRTDGTETPDRLLRLQRFPGPVQDDAKTRATREHPWNAAGDEQSQGDQSGGKADQTDGSNCPLDDARGAQASRHPQCQTPAAYRARQREQRYPGKRATAAFQPDAQANEERREDEADDGANVADEELTCDLPELRDSFPPSTVQPLNTSTVYHGRFNQITQRRDYQSPLLQDRRRRQSEPTRRQIHRDHWHLRSE